MRKLRSSDKIHGFFHIVKELSAKWRAKRVYLPYVQKILACPMCPSCQKFMACPTYQRRELA